MVSCGDDETVIVEDTDDFTWPPGLIQRTEYLRDDGDNSTTYYDYSYDSLFRLTKIVRGNTVGVIYTATYEYSDVNIIESIESVDPSGHAFLPNIHELVDDQIIKTVLQPIVGQFQYSEKIFEYENDMLSNQKDSIFINTDCYELNFLTYSYNDLNQLLSIRTIATRMCGSTNSSDTTLINFEFDDLNNPLSSKPYDPLSNKALLVDQVNLSILFSRGFANNMTVSENQDGERFEYTYTYNDDGYPISRTSTNNFGADGDNHADFDYSITYEYYENE